MRNESPCYGMVHELHIKGDDKFYDRAEGLVDNNPLQNTTYKVGMVVVVSSV